MNRRRRQGSRPCPRTSSPNRSRGGPCRRRATAGPRGAATTPPLCGVGLAGAVVTILSAILLIAGLAGRQPPLDLGWFVVGLTAGLAALLFHAGFRRMFGEEAVAHFAATTADWHVPVLDDRAAPRYPRAVLVSDHERAAVDRLVADNALSVIAVA